MLKSFHRSLFTTMDSITKSAAKKEAKRLEKEARLAAKIPKSAASKSTTKEKEKKEKDKDVDTPFINTTPKGDKKGYLLSLNFYSTALYILLRSITADGGRL